MKSQYLTRLFGAAVVSGLCFAFSPAIVAQSASGFIASGLEKSKTGNYDAAIAEYTKALELNSSYISAYINRGLAKNNQGNFEGAVADFTQVINLKPTFADGYLDRGSAELLEGNLDAAQADFTKVLELKPDDQAYYRRGLTRQCQGNYDGAAADFAKAAEVIAGDDPSSYAALHGALLNRRIGRKSDDHLKSTVNWSNEWTKSLASYLSGGLSEAELLRLASASDGDEKISEETEAQYFVGMTRLIRGDKTTAKADFQKAFDESGPASLLHRLARTELDRP